jgi:hypothetical protein
LDFVTTIKILLSRWYVVIPALLATAAGAYLAMGAVAPSYESTGALVLLGPKTSGAPVQGESPPAEVNPYLEFGGALEVTGDVLSKAMLSDATTRKLAAAGWTAAYEVGTGSDGGSPIINVVATGTSEAVTVGTVNAVEQEMRAELDRRQKLAGAPPSQYIRLEVVATPTTPKVLMGSKIRAAGAVLALGAMTTFGLAFLVESIAESRARRRRERELGVDPKAAKAARKEAKKRKKGGGDEPPDGTPAEPEPVQQPVAAGLAAKAAGNGPVTAGAQSVNSSQGREPGSA